MTKAMPRDTKSRSVQSVDLTVLYSLKTGTDLLRLLKCSHNLLLRNSIVRIISYARQDLYHRCWKRMSTIDSKTRVMTYYGGPTTD